MKTELRKLTQHPWLLCCFFLSLVAGMYSVSSFFPNSDTYFLISTGEYIVTNHTFPNVNPFVMHDGYAIIIQQWLFDVLMYAIYQLAGWFGIYIYSLLISLVNAFFAYRLLGFYTNNVSAKLIVTTIFVSFMSKWFVARPMSISLFLLIAIVIVIKKYQQSRRKSILCWLPVLSLLLVNIHSAMWPMLFIIILPFVFPDDFPIMCDKSNIIIFFKQWIQKHKYILLALLPTTLVGLINPYGIKGALYLLLSYDSASEGNIISEMGSADLISDVGLFIVFTIICLYWYITTKRKDIEMSLVYMTLGSIVMSTLHIRNAWILTFSLIPITAIMLDKLLVLKNKPIKIAKSTSIICLSFIIAMGIIMLQGVDQKPKDSWTAPIEAVSYLNQYDKDDVVIFNDFDNGQYLAFCGYKPFIDARPELFQSKINKKEDLYTEYVKLIKRTANYGDFINKYQFTHILVVDASGMSVYMQSNTQYKQVVEGNGYILYEKITN